MSELRAISDSVRPMRDWALGLVPAAPVSHNVLEHGATEWALNENWHVPVHIVDAASKLSAGPPRVATLAQTHLNQSGPAAHGPEWAPNNVTPSILVKQAHEGLLLVKETGPRMPLDKVWVSLQDSMQSMARDAWQDGVQVLDILKRDQRFTEGAHDEATFDLHQLVQTPAFWVGAALAVADPRKKLKVLDFVLSSVIAQKKKMLISLSNKIKRLDAEFSELGLFEDYTQYLKQRERSNQRQRSANKNLRLAKEGGASKDQLDLLQAEVDNELKAGSELRQKSRALIATRHRFQEQAWAIDAQQETQKERIAQLKEWKRTGKAPKINTKK